MEVVVLGCGGIGLPFAVALASRGTRVVGVDTDAALVRRASEGHTDLLDPGLEPALTGALAEGVIGFVVAAPRSYARARS
jgi:UDP-N-acetyl-D-mannosaminuronate dehydrogenase